MRISDGVVLLVVALVLGVFVVAIMVGALEIVENLP